MIYTTSLLPHMCVDGTLIKDSGCRDKICTTIFMHEDRKKRKEIAWPLWHFPSFFFLLFCWCCASQHSIFTLLFHNKYWCIQCVPLSFASLVFCMMLLLLHCPYCVIYEEKKNEHPYNERARPYSLNSFSLSCERICRWCPTINNKHTAVWVCVSVTEISGVP